MNAQQKTALIAPKIAAYPGYNDQALFAQLTAKTITVHKAIPVKSLYLYLLQNGLWDDFKTNVAPAVSSARDALALFNPDIRTDDAANYALFTGLVQGLVDEPTFPFTAAHQSAVVSMADDLVSWADQNIPDLTEGDIARARA